MSSTPHRPSAPSAPRRQARGERRIAQLLEAAGAVFAAVGYEAATTNAIAVRAGVSPGTLYQFFPNKEAMVRALAADYAARHKVASDRALGLSASEQLAFDDLLDHLIDPLIAFRREAPAFDALFVGSVVSRDLADHIDTLQCEVQTRLERIFAARRPDLSERVIRRHMEVTIQIFKGLLPLALNGSPEERRHGARELKVVIARYLSPLFGDAVRPARTVSNAATSPTRRRGHARTRG